MSSKINPNSSFSTFGIDNLQQHYYGNASRNSAVAAQNNQPKTQTIPRIPKSVTTTIQKGDTPEKIVYRALVKAARRAGLPPSEQKKFAEKFSGVGMNWEAGDPNAADGNKAKTSDYGKNVGEILRINLSKAGIAELQNQRQEYIARGGKLYSNREVSPQKSAAEKQSEKSGVTAEQQERTRMRDLYEKAQILPSSSFGTPSKLRDLKHISGVEMQNISGLSAEDQALAGYIEQRYVDRSNLYGDDKADILQIAKTNGVKIENLSVSNGKADFDMSVESLLKLEIAYIGVQEKANITEAKVKELQNNSAYNQFLIGVGEGAWNNLKDTKQMITDPLGTVRGIVELGKTAGSLGLELAQMSETERLELYAQLGKAGLKGLGEMPLNVATRKIGNFVGALAVDAALGKGIGTAITLLKDLKIGAKIIRETVELSKTVKQTLGNLKVPIPNSKVIVDTAGNKWWMPDVELKKLEVVVKMMKSSDEGLEMLKGGSTAGRETIKDTAEEGLTDVSQKGMKRLKYDLPKDVLRIAKEKLVTLNVARTELIAKLDNLIANSNLLADTKKVLSTAKNSIRDHLTQDDLVGALRDKLGKEVRRSGDGYTYQHFREVKESLSSLDNATLRLVKELDKIPKGTPEYSKISKEIDAIKEMKRRILDFLETK